MSVLYVLTLHHKGAVSEKDGYGAPYFILKSLSHNHKSFCSVPPESALSHFFSPALPVVASLLPVFSTSLGCLSLLPLSPSVLLSVHSGRPSQTFALALGLYLSLYSYTILSFYSFSIIILLSPVSLYTLSVYYIAYILCVL